MQESNFQKISEERIERAKNSKLNNNKEVVMSASKMRRTNGKDGGGGGGGKDLQVLQNEYKHMQVNRNAFANESELVRRFSMKLLILF